jgi:uncharacterized delta-60 repeat protein
MSIMALAASAVFVGPVGAAPGDLDPDFGLAGSSAVDVGPISGDSNDRAAGVALDGSGRTIVAGGTNGPISALGLTRYLSDGTLDPAFGLGGRAVLNLGGGYTDFNEVATAVEIDGSGGILVAGAFDKKMAVFRILDGGTLDASFGVGGVAVVDLGSDEASAEDLALDASGRIVLVGSSIEIPSFDRDVVVARLGADGTADATFDGDGVVRLELGTNAFGRAVGVSGTSILVGGASEGDFLVARLGPDGTLDPGFATGGIATTDFAGLDDFANALVIDGLGRVVLAGTATGVSSLAFARYDTDGDLDPTFDGDGKSTIGPPSVGAAVTIQDLAIDSLDRIVGGGSVYDSGYDTVAVRLLSGGSPDAAFSGDGIAIAGDPADDAAFGLALDGDEPVLAGYGYDTREDFRVVRFDVDGILDPILGGTGVVTTDLGPAHSRIDAATDVGLLSDGRLAAVGWSYDGGYVSSDGVLAVFDADGDPDPTFSGDGLVTIDLGGFEEAYGVVHQPGLGIVVVGWADGELFATRYELDGDLDLTFGVNGIVRFAPGGESGYAWEVALDDLGRIVMAGQIGSDVLVTRLEADGDVDDTFGTDGIARADLPGSVFGESVSFDAASGIVVAAWGSPGFHVVRFTEVGAVDTGFGAGGVASVDLAGNEHAIEATIDAAGRIVAVGRAYDGAAGSMVVARFDDAGTPDPTFGGGDGLVLASVNGTSSDVASGVAIDSDGRIVLAGTAQTWSARVNDFVVVRLLDDGSFDPSFGGDGIEITNLGDDDQAFAVVVDPAGGIVAAGMGGPRQDLVLARYLAAEPPDTTPPDTTIADGPSDPTTETTSTFTFGGSDDRTAPGALTFECSVDGDPFAACVSPLDVSVPVGEHSIAVRAIDGATNTDLTPAIYSWSVIESATGSATPGAGGSVSTGSDPTPIDPVEVTILVPPGTVGGPISVTESGSPTVPPPSGYEFLGEELQIVAPIGSIDAPLHLTFLIDESLALDAEVDHLTIEILRNGIPVLDCLAVGPISPDPCVVLRDRTPGNDIRLEVLTSQASGWVPAARAPVSFTGFLQPVDNAPTVNRTKAGSAVPVRFRLGGVQGLDVFAATYPRSVVVDCDSTDPIDAIEQTVTAGSSSLSYDPATATYTYVWKTDKAWARTCRQLVVRLADGSYQRATFEFTR